MYVVGVEIASNLAHGSVSFFQSSTVLSPLHQRLKFSALSFTSFAAMAFKRSFSPSISLLILLLLLVCLSHCEGRVVARVSYAQAKVARDPHWDEWHHRTDHGGWNSDGGWDEFGNWDDKGGWNDRPPWPPVDIGGPGDGGFRRK